MSTYNKTVWQDGDIITADKMNNIENGIYSYNEDITNVPRAVETDEESSDLDFVDQNGYVIARFEDGHFKTKNFDSSQSATKTEVQTAVGAVAESVDGVEATVTETKTAFDLLVGNYEVNFSSNLYDPSLQTSETISPHYFVNGVPYSSTQFDTSWNCTDFIPVEPETQYVIALVPSVNDNSKPWQGAGYGWFAYDENKSYISTTGSSNNTFTTPANARYIRFNYYISAGKVSLDVLNARCMIVKGDVIPDTYEKYGTSMTSDLQTKIDSSSAGFDYKFSGNDLLIAYGYNDNYDAVVVLNRGRANNLFDFSSLKLKPKDVSLFELETANLSTVWNSGTDMHGPFQFNAVNNADGYHSDSTSPGFVGGNHTLDQLGAGFETATSKYVKYFADGKPVSSGYGKATNFEIRWANNVQAYNTVKEGGGGRSCLTEYHDMIFDGVQFDEIVKLVPLEDIQMGLWYGFQFVSFGSKYTKLRFLDGVNRGIYETTGCKSGNLLCSGMEAWGSDDKIIVTVDPAFDLGKREHVGATYADGGAFTSSSKCYFRIITDSSFVMSAGDAYYLKGSYRFCPSVEATGGEG